MSPVADQLRAAREARKLTINEVAETTKIRTDHIRALEEGNYDAFAAPVYIRGFVRVYATLLKLEVQQVMSALDAELGKTERFSEPPPLGKQQKGILHFITLQLSKVNWQKGATVGIALAILIAIIAGISYWLYNRNSDPLKDVPPAVYSPGKPGQGETLPLPQQPQRSR
jgi:cytoskeletal protein RodZ